MPRRWLLLCGVVPAASLVGSSSSGSEMTTYSYDALGRLVTTSRTGGPSNGIAMATCFDPAGNRMQYSTGTGGAPGCPTWVAPTPTPTPTPSQNPASLPTPTPTPTSTNQPPVAVSDSGTGICSSVITINLVANDTDPDHNTPLVLYSIDATSGASLSTIISSTSASFIAMAPGTYTFNYAVADNLGATGTGQASVTFTGHGECSEPPP